MKMKKTAMCFLMLFVVVSNNFANEIENKSTQIKTSKTLKEQIVELLKGYDGDSINTKARITFIVNKKSELVVLTVHSKNDDVDAFIKGRLNYKKVKTSVQKIMKVYEVSIKIVKT